MKHQISLALSVAAGLSLAACGGGGGGMSGSSSMPPPALSNTAPAVSNLGANQAVLQDSVSDPIPFSVSDKETSAADLKVTLQSSDPSLISTDDIDLAGSGSARTLVLRPKPGAAGSATVTISVADAAGMTSSQSFSLQVMTQQASYTGFVTDALSMPDSSDPAETMGKTWTDTATDNPAAFDSLFQ